MKKIMGFAALLLTVSLIAILPQESIAANSFSGKGSIGFEGEYKQEIYDPENPGVVVDPGETPQTSGDLRIDFVPQFRFGTNQATEEDASYVGYAQLFKESVPARGSFVQVSDYRATGAGWQLSVKQEDQFKNENGSTLDGAYISLDNSWVNSITDSSKAPLIKKDVIQMKVGETQLLASAKTGTGEGTWSVSFGASATNEAGITDTLRPLVDEQNNPVLDSLFENKPIYLNDSVQLHVPGKTKKEAGTTYTTVITWTLSELP